MRRSKTAIREISKRDLLIWANDNAGQIARKDTTKQEEQHTNHNGIGKWHYSKLTEQGDGGQMVKIIEQLKLTATNTIHPPKKNSLYNLITWTSGGGGIHNQLGYILISGNVETWTNYTKVKGGRDPANRKTATDSSKWRSELNLKG